MRILCKCNVQNCCQIAYAASEFTPLSGTAWGNGGAVTANYQHTHFTLAMKRWRVWRNYEVGRKTTYSEMAARSRAEAQSPGWPNCKEHLPACLLSGYLRGVEVGNKSWGLDGSELQGAVLALLLLLLLVLIRLVLLLLLRLVILILPLLLLLLYYHR